MCCPLAAGKAKREQRKKSQYGLHSASYRDHNHWTKYLILDKPTRAPEQDVDLHNNNSNVIPRGRCIGDGSGAVSSGLESGSESDAVAVGKASGVRQV
eukprot:8573685-Pyramimonas_sp.AAC.1